MAAESRSSATTATELSTASTSSRAATTDRELVITRNLETYMSIFHASCSPWTSRMLSVLRIVAGLMFVSAGTMKLFGYPPSPGPMPPVVLMSELGVAAILETFGGLAIVLGVLTRPVAFLLAGEMAVAYFQFHAPHSFFPTTSNGVPAVLYCFLFLYLTFAGAGPWSIDLMIARAKHGDVARHGDAEGRRQMAVLDA